MEDIVHNKLIFIISILFSISGYANVKYCNNPAIVNEYDQNKSNIEAVVKCSEEAKKVNLGFQGTNKVIFVLDKEISSLQFVINIAGILQIHWNL